MRSKESRLAMKVRWIGAFLLLFGLNAAIGTEASADGCKDEKIECMEVTAPRIVIRDREAMLAFEAAEKERQNQEKLKAEEERKREQQFGR